MPSASVRLREPDYESDASPARGAVEAYYRAVAPLYDREPFDRGEGFWASIAAEHDGERVIELGCGTGRVTSALAAHASLVVGVDLSSEMLRRAKRRLVRARNVLLVRADVRRLAFRRVFDLAVCADVDGHLLTDEDRASTLRAVAQSLAPRGRYVVDALWLSDEAIAAAAAGGWISERRSSLHGRTLRVRESWKCDRQTGRCRVRYEYFRENVKPLVAEFDARYWTVDELRQQFTAAGLTIEALWGGYDRRPWEQRTATSLLVGARRAAGP
jgi:SAM-dependent methyltransferase